MGQAPIAQSCRRFTQRQRVGVSRRVGQLAGAVVVSGKQFAGSHNDGADRHLAAARAGLGLLQGDRHPASVIGAHRANVAGSMNQRLVG